MKRIAILIGINKYECGSNLKGCLQDASGLAVKWGKLGVDEIHSLRDSEATAANWLDLLDKVISDAKAGDEIFHGHSHHGSQAQDSSEADGLAEVWCPTDWPKMITDKQVSKLLDKLHPEAFFLDWADCCHAFDSLRELGYKYEQPRSLVYPGLDRQTCRRIASTVIEPRRNVVQLAACRSEQTSADAFIDGAYCGAFTHFALECWNELGNPGLGALIDATSLRLSRYGYAQRPEYWGAAANSGRSILLREKVAGASRSGSEA